MPRGMFTPRNSLPMRRRLPSPATVTPLHRHPVLPQRLVERGLQVGALPPFADDQRTRGAERAGRGSSEHAKRDASGGVVTRGPADDRDRDLQARARIRALRRSVDDADLCGRAVERRDDGAFAQHRGGRALRAALRDEVQEEARQPEPHGDRDEEQQHDHPDARLGQDRLRRQVEREADARRGECGDERRTVPEAGDQERRSPGRDEREDRDDTHPEGRIGEPVARRQEGQDAAGGGGLAASGAGGFYRAPVFLVRWTGSVDSQLRRF